MNIILEAILYCLVTNSGGAFSVEWWLVLTTVNHYGYTSLHWGDLWAAILISLKATPFLQPGCFCADSLLFGFHKRL